MRIMHAVGVRSLIFLLLANLDQVVNAFSRLIRYVMCNRATLSGTRLGPNHCHCREFLKIRKGLGAQRQLSSAAPDMKQSNSNHERSNSN